MTDNNKLSKLRLAVLTAAIMTGAISAPLIAQADDSNVSEKDMLTQAVALYEKLSGDVVTVPDALKSQCNDENLGKAVMLGFTNSDAANTVSDAVAIRKQDALTILYKTVISYDYSYALTTDEIDKIMNSCYDNALVDEENRAAYAFMLKHGIIADSYNTEPDKLITWDSCATLVDVMYDLFVQNTTFSVGENEIKMGSSAEELINTFGEPVRIDKSDYDFSWYVYNSDPSQFMMVGVKEGRICAFFSNSDRFSFDGINSGDDYLLAYKYANNDNFRIFKDSENRIDAIMYNPYTKSDVALSNNAYLRACELVDIINSHRAKSDMESLNIDNELYTKANDMVSQPKYHELARDARYSHILGNAQHEEGYDIFAIYEKLINTQSDCFSEDLKSIGVATYVDEGFNIYSSIISSDKDAELTTVPADVEAVEPQSFVFETSADIPAASNTTEAEEFVFETPDTVSDASTAMAGSWRM